MNKWIPPKSPYDLLQERFWPNEWKILVVCLMLNQTSRKQVEPMIHDFFSKYPDPKSILDSKEEDLFSILKPLGLANRRVKTLKKFSSDYINLDWENAKDLYGCGKYANDAHEIFIKGKWKEVVPNDHALVFYHDYLNENFDRIQEYA